MEINPVNYCKERIESNKEQIFHWHEINQPADVRLFVTRDNQHDRDGSCEDEHECGKKQQQQLQLQ